MTQHPGWTGHVTTSWKVPPGETEKEAAREGVMYDGREKVLYWADALSEIAFVVPSKIGKW